MKFHTKTDKELIQIYIAGNEGGIKTLIDRHKDRVFTSILLLVKDTYLAEDLFQDTFIKVIKTLKNGRYNEEGKFLPWVVRIAHNLVIDHYRKEKRKPVIMSQDGFDIFDVLKFYDESVEERILKEQTYQELRTLIQRLPDEQKEVLIMRHYGEMSFRDIAEITEVSINTALGRMRYALNNLRKMIRSNELMYR